MRSTVNSSASSSSPSSPSGGSGGMTRASHMLYHQTIIPTQHVSHCLSGTFTIHGAQDLLLVRHNTLELWTLHTDANKLEFVHSTPLFTNVYDIASVPVTFERLGANTNSSFNNNNNNNNNSSNNSATLPQLIAVTSETGYLVILQYRLRHRNTFQSAGASNLTSNHHGKYSAALLSGEFVRISELSLGRSGARLTVPGFRLAVDPHGRALLVSALMRLKYVVPLSTTTINPSKDDDENSDNDNDTNNEESKRRGSNTTNSSKNNSKNADQICVVNVCSPVEAHRNTVVYGICALEGCMDNAVFVALEQELAEDVENSPSASQSPPSKQLVVYEYVQGLHQVHRTHLMKVQPTAHKIISVPAQPCGPGGVLVCTDTELIWYDILQARNNTGVLSLQNQQQLASGATAVAVFKATTPFQRRMSFMRHHFDPMIIASATAHVANNFFMLLQDENGDLHRVMLSSADVNAWYDATRVREQIEKERQRRYMFDPTRSLAHQQQIDLQLPLPPMPPSPLTVRYFDTIPVVSCMSLFRSGFLFCGSESHFAHGLRRIIKEGFQQDRDFILKAIRVEDVSSSSSAAKKLLQAKQQQQEKQAKSEPIEKSIKSEQESSSNGTEEEELSATVQVKKEETTNGEESSSSSVKKEENNKNSVGEKVPGAPAKTADGFLVPNLPVRATNPSSTSSNSTASTQQQQQSLVVKRDVRVVRLYEPHTTQTRLHMELVDTYPNTPPIVSMNVTIPAAAAAPHGSEDSKQEQQQQQPHAQIECASGRGGGSCLQRALYGYTALLQNTFALPTGFEMVIPLRSLMAMRHLYLEERKNINTGDSTTLVAGGAHFVWHDRVLLSTRQGTSVMSMMGTTEQDTLSGFVTSERTLAASAVLRGLGFVQVTPHGIHAIPASASEYDDPNDAAAAAAGETSSDSEEDNEMNDNEEGLQQRKRGRDADGKRKKKKSRHGHHHHHNNLPRLVSTTWTHPQGKAVLAAAASERMVVISLREGGVASFDFGLTGTELRVVHAFQTFPDCRAISLLQRTSQSSNVPVPGSTKSFSMSSSSAGGGVAAELVALATVTQEVVIARAAKLNEPLETIRLRGRKNTTSSSSSSSSIICSVLLTHLTSRQTLFPQLFCFIGHMDGSLTRCELDTVTGKLIGITVLSCGTAPCRLIGGDGWHVCYILCGTTYWRCDVRDGVQKTTPLRFSKPQVNFAAFDRPPQQVLEAARMRSMSGSGSQAAQMMAAAISRCTNINSSSSSTATSSAAIRDEEVLAVTGNLLSLFKFQSSNTSLQYSFASSMLPVAGRRIVRHPTRAEYLILACSEHRGLGPTEAQQMDEQMKQYQRQQREAKANPSTPQGINALNHAAGPLTSEYRSPAEPNCYASTIQLFHKGRNQLLRPFYFEDRVAVLGMAVGSFYQDFGKEPVVIVACAENFTHGSGFNRAPSWKHSRLQTFRFVAAPVKTRNGDTVEELRLQREHVTVIPEVNDYPSALHICEEVGLLFVGLGAENGLQIFSWARSKLLRKRTLPNVSARITCIDTIFTTSAEDLSRSNGVSSSSSSSSAGRIAPFYCSDIFRDDFSGSTHVAKRKRLLIACGTANHSVFIATLQMKDEINDSRASFLMVVATDPMPRYLTSAVFVDERTIAASDRFGYVTFLRLPPQARLGLSESWERYSDLELAELERFAKEEQLLEEIASHCVGQTVTSLQVRYYDPSRNSGGSHKNEENVENEREGGEGGGSLHDTFRRNYIVFYGTSLGSVGAYVPFTSEEDAACAAYAQPLLAQHATNLFIPGSGGGALPITSAGRQIASSPVYPSHHVTEGDLLKLVTESASEVFPLDAKEDFDETMRRRFAAEMWERRVLALPPRTLPSVKELCAKMRALVTLPP